LLEQDFEFGSLHLTTKGWDVLQRKEKVLVPCDRAPLNATGAAAPVQKDSSAVIRPATRHRFQEIGQLFAAGQSLDQVARHFDILPETVIQHLCRFHEAGGTLGPERLLAASHLTGPERARVLSAFERLGDERLAPIYEALSRAVPYQELHLLRLYRLLTLRQYD
jgi:transposase